MVSCLWHYGGRGSWCHEIVEWLTRGCEHRIGLDGRTASGIVVIKADSVPAVEMLDHELATLERGVLIVCGNEEGTFDTARLTHPRMRVWLQTPAQNQIAHQYLPWGWTPRELTPNHSERLFDWSFAGQDTHQRRHECI